MPAYRSILAALLIVVVANGITIDRAHSATDIGEAASVAAMVESNLGGALATIRTGDPVFQDQAITTDDTGVAQIAFRDGTKLAIGPGSSVVLDDFVYSSEGSVTNVAIGIVRGSFRFISGNSVRDAYEITTQLATIGVRGTAFDLFATESGEVAIAMIDGEVIVCPGAQPCRTHGVVGRFLHMTENGIFALRDAWDGSFLGDVAFARAFPFLADQESLLSTMRGSAEIVGGYVSKAGDAIQDVGTVIEKAIESIPKPRAPKIRVPRLFK